VFVAEQRLRPRDGERQDMVYRQNTSECEQAGRVPLNDERKRPRPWLFERDKSVAEALGQFVGGEILQAFEDIGLVPVRLSTCFLHTRILFLVSPLDKLNNSCYYFAG
jgi:hypothetical protein